LREVDSLDPPDITEDSAMARSTRLNSAWLGLACFIAVPALAQTSIVPGQSPPSGAGTGTVESQPLAPPPGAAQPAPVAPEQKPAESAQPAVPAIPPAVAPVTPPGVATPPAATPPVVAAQPADPNATLAGKPGDSGNVDDLTLAPRPAAMTGGRSSWDDGAKNLAAAFARMRGEIEKAGAKVAGRPFAIFVETDDNAFRFEAFLPIDAAPAGRDSFSAETRITQTPEGRALRFIHQGPYDDVDSTYEAITAYLDAKGINVRDAFIEEYVGELKDSADSKFEVNIYVQPR
jgi:effector-binding domain-containing protein